MKLVTAEKLMLHLLQRLLEQQKKDGYYETDIG